MRIYLKVFMDDTVVLMNVSAPTAGGRGQTMAGVLSSFAG